MKALRFDRWEARVMKNWDWILGGVVVLILGAIVLVSGCDNGEKALDEVTRLLKIRSILRRKILKR